MSEREFRALGRRLARAQAKVDEIKEEAKEAVKAGEGAGCTESDMHRWLGVNRLTVRLWLGKPPPSRRRKQPDTAP